LPLSLCLCGFARWHYGGISGIILPIIIVGFVWIFVMLLGATLLHYQCSLFAPVVQKGCTFSFIHQPLVSLLNTNLQKSDTNFTFQLIIAHKNDKKSSENATNATIMPPREPL